MITCDIFYMFEMYLRCLGKCYLLPLCLYTGVIYNVVMIANACLCFILNQMCYISLCFYLPKTQTLQVSIFHLSQFFFWTYNNNWTNSLIVMQVLFVRHIILDADSGLVKLVVITNVFFNKQQLKIEIKRFIFVKCIKSRFFCNS